MLFKTYPKAIYNLKTVRMWLISCLLFIVGLASAENDRDLSMCGKWRHGNASRNLAYNLETGCERIVISANESTLSIGGRITAKCKQSSSIPLEPNPSQTHSDFCVFWDPLVDLLIVEVNGKNHTLCKPNGLQGSCCTDLSLRYLKNASLYGIENGNIKGDIIKNEVMEKYTFEGDSINCKESFCDEASEKNKGANMIEEVLLKSNMTGLVDLPCAQGTVFEIDIGFTGHNFTVPAPKTVPPNTVPSIYLPPSLKSVTKAKSKVVCTYYRNKTLFQGGSSDSTILNDIVGLSVENEVIKNLSEPVRIRFHFFVLPANSIHCASWDTREDNEVKWRSEGCETVIINAVEIECRCNHLGYITVLVQQNTVIHLHVHTLTFISGLGSAVSLFSCLVLFFWLWKRRGEKERSVLVHRGLGVSEFFLYLSVSLSCTLANTGNETVCKTMGALLHYSLLSTLCWMTVEMFHKFSLACGVFSSSLPAWVFYVAGFGIPAILVCRLLSVGDIYGLRMIVPSYFMCWMLDSDKSRLAHYIFNIGLLAVVVSSGAVLFFFVVIKSQTHPERRKNRTAFLTIWVLTCMFAATWGLCFLNFGLVSKAAIVLFCIISSCQGLFHMLRYYTLERMKKRSELSSDGENTQSVMLQPRTVE